MELHTNRKREREKVRDIDVQWFGWCTKYYIFYAVYELFINYIKIWEIDYLYNEAAVCYIYILYFNGKI